MEITGLRFSSQQAVTARALLSHTAGISPFNLSGYDSNQATPTLLQILQGASPATNPALKVESLPGTRYAYSSLGYAILEQYLTDITQQPLDTLAHHMVFQPLSMNHSLFAQTLPASLLSQAASGHQLDGSVVPGNWRRHPEQAAAGMWSTASDLAKFAISIQNASLGQNNSLLSQAQVNTLLTPVRNDYGLGFELDHDGVQTAFHHSGSNLGYKALLFAYTKTGQGAVILTNGDAGWPLIEELMRSIAFEYKWEDYLPIVRDSIPSELSLLDLFTGNFSVSNTQLQIYREGNQLYVAGPPIGSTPAKLIASGAYDFFIREKDVTLHFDTNGSAPIETITFVDGKPRQGKRISTLNKK